MGPGDAFAVPELLTGLATADTDDLVSGLVSSLVRSSGTQFWMRMSIMAATVSSSGRSRGLDTELSTKLNLS